MDQREVERAKLEAVCEEIKVCQKCDLCFEGNAVCGEGNSRAKIMFIGEAPGRSEAETGRPFVGRARPGVRACGLHLRRSRQKDEARVHPLRSSDTDRIRRRSHRRRGR